MAPVDDWLWLAWVAVALASGVVEMLTLTLVGLMISGGALSAAAVTALTGEPVAGVIGFAISTGLLLVLARPPLLRLMERSAVAPTSTGTAALVGRTAEVVQPVGPHGGLVRLAGETWSARRESEAGPDYETGSPVRVVAIDGATAVVRPERDGGPTTPEAIGGPM